MRLEAFSRRRRSTAAVNSFDCFHRLAAVTQPRFSAAFTAPRPGARLLTFIDLNQVSRYMMEQMTENDVDGVADEVPPAVTYGHREEFDNVLFSFFFLFSFLSITGERLC